MRTEKNLQDYIKKQCKTHDILCYKFASPAQRGVPDLLLITRVGVVWFVEVKSPVGTGRLTELQLRHLTRLAAHRVGTAVIDSTAKADELISDLHLLTTKALSHEDTQH